MNFFAHATVARWRSSDPQFALGAMLPDLGGMLGLRLLHAADPLIAQGIEFHHATDAAFHAAPRFVALCSEGLATLGAAGVARGAARAVAHVGSELLLDGELSHDTQACEAYRAALGAARIERLGFADLSDQDSRRVQAAIERLRAAALPESYRDPDFTLDRLQMILARRPRLALANHELTPVRAYVHALHAQMGEAAPELMRQVRLRLAPDVATLPNSASL
jgi:acyl carrier protein phosphodiesterase